MGGQRYLCQGELGRRSHGVSIMHGRGRKDGLTGARGGEEAEGAAGGEARTGGLAGVSPNFDNFPPLARPARPVQAAAVPKSWRRISSRRAGV